MIGSKLVRRWLPICPWEEWEWPASATMPFFCIRRSFPRWSTQQLEAENDGRTEPPNLFLLFLHFQVKHVLFFFWGILNPKNFGRTSYSATELASIVAWFIINTFGQEAVLEVRTANSPTKGRQKCKITRPRCRHFCVSPKNGDPKNWRFFFFRSGKPNRILGV